MADLPRRLWQWWKRFAERVGNIQARLLLTALYFLVVSPVAILLKLLADPLALTPPSPWKGEGKSEGREKSASRGYRIPSPLGGEGQGEGDVRASGWVPREGRATDLDEGRRQA